MNKLAELLDRGRALPGVEEGTHTGTLHKLVRASQKPNLNRKHGRTERVPLDRRPVRPAR